MQILILENTNKKQKIWTLLKSSYQEENFLHTMEVKVGNAFSSYQIFSKNNNIAYDFLL